MKLQLSVLLPVTLVLGASIINTGAYAQSSNKVWKINDILEERSSASDKARPRYCQGGVFKPCVCPSDATKKVQYRPAVRECGNKAAIILSGRYYYAFSAVVRDHLNRDRFPLQGINGCTPHERDTLGLNKCSAFKSQKTIKRTHKKGNAKILCLGASGYSSIFQKVKRITVKLADDPKSGNDPLARLCIAAPDKALN